MRPQRDGVPLAAPADKTTSYERVPCACGGNIEGRTLPIWRQKFGGEVEYRCDTCGRVETAEERGAAGPVRRKHATPAREDKAPPVLRVCAFDQCGRTFTPRKPGEGRRYCSVECSNRSRTPDLRRLSLENLPKARAALAVAVRVRYQSKAAQMDLALGSWVKCAGPDCTVKVAQHDTQPGRKQRYCSPSCNSRAFRLRRKARAA